MPTSIKATVEHFSSARHFPDIIISNFVTLKIWIMVTTYNIRNGIIRWRISTSIKVMLDHFSPALTVFQILTFQITWPSKYRSRSRYVTFALTPFDGKYTTFYSMTTASFALSLTIYEIFSNQIKFHKFYLENKGQDHGGEKQDLRRSTRNDRFYIIDFFFRILATLEHTLCKLVTYTHTHTYTQSDRQGDDYMQNLRSRLPKKFARPLITSTY